MLLKMDQLRKGKHDRAEQGFNTETGVANQKLFFLASTEPIFCLMLKEMHVQQLLTLH